MGGGGNFFKNVGDSIVDPLKRTTDAFGNAITQGTNSIETAGQQTFDSVSDASRQVGQLPHDVSNIKGVYTPPDIPDPGAPVVPQQVDPAVLDQLRRQRMLNQYRGSGSATLLGGPSLNTSGNTSLGNASGGKTQLGY